MTTFIFGILVLIFGYLFYSKYVEVQFAPDDRETPAKISNDGVDFIPMKKSKNSLIINLGQYIV